MKNKYSQYLTLLILLISSSFSVWGGGSFCESQVSGNWSDASTWTNCAGTIPGNGAYVTIKNNHLVSLDTDTDTINSITVEALGDLNVANNPSGSSYTLSGNSNIGETFDLSNASIVLSENLIIDAPAKTILMGAVDGAFGLTLNSSVETRFNGIIGGATALTSLITNAGGTTVFAESTGGVNDPNIIVNGPRIFNDSVVIVRTVNFIGTGGPITFNGMVNSSNGDYSLIFSNIGNSTITFNADVGTTTALDSFRIFNSDNSTVVLNLAQFNTNDLQIWDTNLLLNSPTDVVSLTSVSNDFILIGSGSYTVRSQTGGEDGLIINTNNSVTINSVVGDNNQQLSNLTINSVLSTIIGSSSITVTGTQEYSGPVVFNVDSILSASIVEMQSTVNINDNDLTFDTSNNAGLSGIDGVLSGSGDLIINGNGVVTFSSINTLSGNIIVNDGIISNTNAAENIFPAVTLFSISNGAQADLGGLGTGVFNLENTQRLVGTGAFRSLLYSKLGSVVSPGFSTGVLDVDELHMFTSSVISIELNGVTAGNDHDQIVTDVSNLDKDSNGGTTLDISLGYVPNVNDSFIIINNTDVFPVSGFFNGLPEGATFSIDDNLFSISYTGGNDNDVVLTALGSSILYVNENVAIAGDGSSWTDAFGNLQDALAVAVSGHEIWVAQGVYYPDVGTGQSNDLQSSTFNLINGVKIYGGFDGTETDLSMRDSVANVTVLSGDIDGNDAVDSDGVTAHFDDLVGNNAYHVVTTLLTDDTTVIDGLAITAGWASGANSDDIGAAIYCSNSSVKINAVIVQGNRTEDRAALWDCNSLISQTSFINNFAGDVGAITTTPTTFTDTMFIGNRAGNQGSVFYMSGGILNLTRVQFIANFNQSVVRVQGTTLNFNDVLFSGNQTRGVLDLSSVVNGTLNNITMIGNRSSLVGAAIKSSTGGNLTINNSIFWNNQGTTGLGTLEANIDHTGTGIITVNSSIMQDSATSLLWDTTILVDGGGNLDEDPLVVLNTDPSSAPTIVGDAHLTSLSMAIDTGDNSAVTSTIDLDSRKRIFNGTVDMGAYEYFEELIFSDGFE